MKLRFILTVLSLLAFLSVCATGYLYYSSLRDEAFNEANEQAAVHAERAKNHISYLLSENLRTVTVLAGLQELREALNKEDPGSLAKVNSILDHFNESLKVDVCYLMNRDGNTIATSNRNAPDSFLGKNYAFRPYFRQSIKGTPAIYMALGVTSKKRGAYYSHPIYGENKKSPMGVAVIKASIDSIEKDLKEERESTALLIDPQGVIFLSNRDDWLFQALWDLPPEELPQIAQTKQFGEGPFYWTGLQKKEGAGAIDHSGNKYLIHQMELDNYPGWNIVFLRSLRSVSEDVSNQLMRKTGPFVWILCVLIVFLVFYLYRKASHEISQRKTAENALRASEERYRQIVNNANDLIYRTTADGYFTFSNPTMKKILDYSTEELMGKHYLEVIQTDYRKNVERFYGLQFVKKIPNTYYEFPIITRSGGEKWLGQNVQLIMEGDRIVGFQAVARDITDRRQAEISSRQVTFLNQVARRISSELNLEDLFSATLKAIHETFHYDNIALFLMEENGKSLNLEAVVGEYPYTSRIKKFHIPVGKGMIGHAAKTGKVQVTGDVTQDPHYFCPFPVETKSEMTVPIITGRTVIGVLDLQSAQGDAFDETDVTVMKTLADQTAVAIENARLFATAQQELAERKQAEEALRESEERFRKFADEASFDGILIHEEGNILDVNEIFSKMYGYKRHELLGMDALDTVAPEAREIARKHIREKYEKPYQAAGLRKDGSTFPMEIRGKTIPYQGRKARVVSIHDITERKRAEEENEKLQSQLQQAQKMEAIATLAGGIAHQFNNALSVIAGNLELLKLDLPEHEFIEKHTKPMASSVDRMSQLTKQLLAYARGGQYQIKTISLSDFARNTLPLIEHALKPSVDIETHLPPDILSVKADLTQLQMVLSAIVSNAAEAIEGAGHIRISCKNEKVTKENAEDYPGLNPGLYVALIIEDDGKGMDQETRSRIFDPFFTTKFQGRGLSMAAVYGIIKKHGGVISIDSALDQGTVVRIHLPAVEQEVETPRELKIESPKGTGTILIIEDEGMLMNVIQDFLKRMGYRVLEARTGTEAVHIAESHNGHIDLAILDIVLPDMEGKTIYPLLMKARPGLKVIVCSGYSIDGPAQDILNAGAQGFIQKPFSPVTLSEKIKEVLRAIRLNCR